MSNVSSMLHVQPIIMIMLLSHSHLGKTSNPIRNEKKNVPRRVDFDRRQFKTSRSVLILQRVPPSPIKAASIIELKIDRGPTKGWYSRFLGVGKRKTSIRCGVGGGVIAL
jgi:hypothetical protein